MRCPVCDLEYKEDECPQCGQLMNKTMDEKPWIQGEDNADNQREE